jgi:subtilisin-like proprotein convertase family protein
MGAVTGLDYMPITRYDNTHTNDELISLALNSPSELVRELGIRLHLALCGEYDDEEGVPKSDKPELNDFCVEKTVGNVTMCQDAATYKVGCPGCFHEFTLINSTLEKK